MKTRPWPLVVLAFAHLLAPFGNLITNSWLQKVTVWQYFKIIVHPENAGHALIFFGVPIVSAGLIYACKKWSYWTYLVLMTVPFAYSFYSWRMSPALMPAVVLVLFYIMNSLIVGYFVLPAVRRVYFDHRLRWWEPKPRFGIQYEAPLFVGEQRFMGEVRNISSGGVFWATQVTIPLMTDIKLELNGGGDEIEVKGQAIYRREQEPSGYGIKFNLDAKTEDQILTMIARLQDEGAILVGRIPGPEDSFTYWLRNLFKHKSAWLPTPVNTPGSVETSPSIKGSTSKSDDRVS